MATLRIIEPSGKPDEQALARNLSILRDAGHLVVCERETAHPDFPINAGSTAARAESLQNALTETSSDIVIAARGGYGASDLLGLLDFAAIARARPKPLIGFSDISALHSALLSSLGRIGIHGPMPGSGLFGSRGKDIDALMTLLGCSLPWHGAISVTARDTDVNVDGWLYGGNLAVLSNLIGTPWFPTSLAGAIVFLEDVGEHAGRLGRYLSQWILAGKTQNLSAIVLGRFTDGGDTPAGHESMIISELARRVDCPVFRSQEFGHVSPNMPLACGAEASIRNGRLHWSMDRFTQCHS